MFLLLLLSASISGKDHSRTKTSQKISLAKKSLQRKSLQKKTSMIKISGKESSKKKPAAKDIPSGAAAARRITVVMENYPPNCFIENAPKEIPAIVFGNSLLKSVQAKSNKDFLLSVYHLDRKAGKYRLEENADKATLDKIKDILFSSGFLKASGFEIEIVQAVFSTMGLQPLYREYPWARCIGTMKSGKADAILTIFRSKERQKYLYFPSEPTLLETNVFFKLKGASPSFDGDLRKLKNYVIGVKASTSYGEKFDQAKFIKKEEVSFTESVVKLVENKRVDLGISSLPLLKYLMKHNGKEDKFSLLRPQVSREPLYIAFSRERDLKKISEEFAVKLAKFKKTEKYKKILKKYGIENS
jgi:polar amino acid transport system substrate-binding protein